MINSKSKSILTLISIGTLAIGTGQPVFATYTRREIEAASHLFETLEKEDDLELAFQELLEVTEQHFTSEATLYDTDFKAVLTTDNQKSLFSFETLELEKASPFRLPNWNLNSIIIRTEESNSEEVDYSDLNLLTREQQLEFLWGIDAIHTYIETINPTSFDHRLFFEMIFDHLDHEVIWRPMIKRDANGIPLLDEEGREIPLYAQATDSNGVGLWERDEDGILLVVKNIYDRNGEILGHERIYNDDGTPLSEVDERGFLLPIRGEQLQELVSEKIHLNFKVLELTPAQLETLNTSLDQIDQITVGHLGRFQDHTGRNVHLSPNTFWTSGSLEAVNNNDYRERFNAFNAPSLQSLITQINARFGEGFADLLLTEGRRYYSHFNSTAIVPDYLIGQNARYVVNSAEEAHYSRHIKMMLDENGHEVPLALTAEQILIIDPSLRPSDLKQDGYITINFTQDGLEAAQVEMTPFWQNIIKGAGTQGLTLSASKAIETSIDRDVSSPYVNGMFGSIGGTSSGNNIINITSWIATGQANSGSWRFVGENISPETLTQVTWDSLENQTTSWGSGSYNMQARLNALGTTDTLTIAMPYRSYNLGFASNNPNNQYYITNGGTNGLLFLTIRRNTAENRSIMGIESPTTAQSNQSFVWQKYTIEVTEIEHELYHFVSYSTAIDEKFNFDFATIKSFEGISIELPIIPEVEPEHENGPPPPDPEESENGRPRDEKPEIPNEEKTEIPSKTDDLEKENLVYSPPESEIEQNQQELLPKTGVENSMPLLLAGFLSIFTAGLLKFSRNKK